MLHGYFSSSYVHNFNSASWIRFSRAISYRWVAKACALLLAASLFIGSGFSQNVLQATESIQAALRAQDYDHALYIARSALERTPGDVKLLTLEGVTLALQGKRRPALAAFNKALSIAPKDLQALRGAAQIEYQLGNPGARHLLEEIVRAQPQDQTAHAMLGVIAAQRNDCIAAGNHFYKAGPTIWSNKQSLELYGYCLEQLKRPREAVPVFQRLLIIEPQNAYARYDLAVVQSFVGDGKDAIDTLAPLLGREDADSDVLSLAADVYEMVGDTPHAADFLRQAIVLAPTNSNYYLAFAALSFDHLSFQVGVDMVNAGLQRIPTSASLFVARGLLYVQLGQYDKAEDDFITAERLDPAEGLGADAQSLLESSKRDPDEALKEIRLQLNKRPKDALLHFLLARIQYHRGFAVGTAGFEEALHAAQRAVELNPGLIYARNLLSTLYLVAGKTELAIKESRATMRLDPDNQAALYHLLMALRKSGDVSEIPSLTEHLSSVIQGAAKREQYRNRFRLIDQVGSKQE